MSYKIRNRFASIATNDPENDLSPRVVLERTVREGAVIWVSTDAPETVIVDGRTTREADAELRKAYAFGGWELKLIGYGSHRLTVR